MQRCGSYRPNTHPGAPSGVIGEYARGSAADPHAAVAAAQAGSHGPRGLGPHAQDFTRGAPRP